MKRILTLLFLTSTYLGEAQNLLTPRALGTGGQSAVLQAESALFGNPAGLAVLENTAAYAAFERRFLLADLDLMGVAAALPTRSGSFGLLAQNFGFEEFRQQKFGLAYARKLTNLLMIGGQIDYLQTQINEYGNDGLLSFEVGIQAEISRQVLLGAHVLNPAPVEFSSGERVPALLRLGAVYRPSAKANVGLELEKDADFPLRAKAGVAYSPAEIIQFGVGFSSGPTLFHLGVGLLLESGLRVDTAFRYHQTLGVTPSVGVGYGFGKKSK